MAKKHDLIAEITILAVAMGLEAVVTEGKKNEELTAIRNDLLMKLEEVPQEVKDKVAAAMADATDATNAPTAPTKPTPPPPPTGTYVVAPGKAITTLRGIKIEDDHVTVAMLAGGREAMDMLIEKGFINK